MDKVYFKMILIIGLIESLVMIVLGWILNRQMVNFKMHLQHTLLGFYNILPEYIDNQFVNIITLGNFLMIFGVIFIIIIILLNILYQRENNNNL